MYKFKFYGNEFTFFEGETPEIKEAIQQKLNNINKSERLKREAAEAESQKLLASLETLKADFNGTREQKEALEAQISEIKEKGLSEAEKIQRALKQKEAELNTIKSESEKSLKDWQSKYESQMINNAILSEANKKDMEVFNPSQFLDYLAPKTKVVEEKVVVKFRDYDAEGKSFDNELPVNEAVKRMHELPNEYGNLFKTNAIKGLGDKGAPNAERFDNKRVPKTVEDYKKNRDKYLGRGK